MPFSEDFLKQFTVTEDKWKCSICSLINLKADEKCKSCENPNPNFKGKRKADNNIDENENKKPKNGFVFNVNPNNANNVFNFGNNGANANNANNVFNFGTNANTSANTNSSIGFKFNVPTNTGFNFNTQSNDKKEDDKEDENEDIGDLKIHNKVFVMGSGEMGQLGLNFDEDEYEAPKPHYLSFNKNIIKIACGSMHCLALTDDNTIYSWGINDKGALGRTGDDKHPQPIDKSAYNNTKVIDITCGNSHSCLLNDNGEIYSWGVYQDDHGDIGFGVKGKVELKPIKLIYPKGVKNVIKIKSGGDYTLFITNKNELYGLGSNEQNQLGRRSADRLKDRNLTPHLINIPIRSKKDKKVKDVFCGIYHVICLLENSKVYGWGQNTSGQLGLGDYENRLTPTLIPFFNDKKAIEFACGMHHSLGLCDDGKVYSFGATAYGKLGIGKSTDNSKPSPVLINSLKDIKHINCGNDHSLCISKDGILYTWGFGDMLQLGNGDYIDEYEPKLIKTKGKVIEIGGGSQHSIIIEKI